MDLYWVTKAIVGPILRSLFRPWVRGAEHVPVTGGVILASNHLSFSDSVFLPLVLKRRVTFLAKNEYFTGPGIKGRLQRMFFQGIGQVPIDRSGANASAPALASGLRLLQRGQVLGLYPEGTRSPDGRLYRGKTGVARLALESRVPVLPVAMIGTDKVQPIGRTVPSIRRIGIIIGRPLDFSRYEGLVDDRFVQRSVTDEIMYELMRLSGQEYVDEYASVAKERMAAERRQRVVTSVLETVHGITGADTTRLSEVLLRDGHRELEPGDVRDAAAAAGGQPGKAADAPAPGTTDVMPQEQAGDPGDPPKLRS